MPVTNKFLENVGKSSIRGNVVATPDFMFWAGSDNTFIGTETTIVNDYFDKGVVWVSDGVDNKFNIELATTDANGSYIEAYGLTDNIVVGEGNPLILLPSDIGMKASSFSVEIEGKILFRRPG